MIELPTQSPPLRTGGNGTPSKVEANPKNPKGWLDALRDAKESPESKGDASEGVKVKAALKSVPRAVPYQEAGLTVDAAPASAEDEMADALGLISVLFQLWPDEAGDGCGVTGGPEIPAKEKAPSLLPDDGAAVAGAAPLALPIVPLNPETAPGAAMSSQPFRLSTKAGSGLAKYAALATDSGSAQAPSEVAVTPKAGAAPALQTSPPKGQASTLPPPTAGEASPAIAVVQAASVTVAAIPEAKAPASGEKASAPVAGFASGKAPELPAATVPVPQKNPGEDAARVRTLLRSAFGDGPVGGEKVTGTSKAKTTASEAGPTLDAAGAAALARQSGTSKAPAAVPAVPKLVPVLREAVRSLLPVPPGRSVQISVNAQGLGEVKISLREENGALVARIEGGSPEAQQALKAAAPQLAQVFKDEGQPLKRLELAGGSAQEGLNDSLGGGARDADASSARKERQEARERYEDLKEAS
jgi:flagellar hook-length control protein FliK